MRAERVSDVVVELEAGFLKEERLPVISAQAGVIVQIYDRKTGEEPPVVDSLEAELLGQVHPESVLENVQVVAVKSETGLVDQSRTKHMDLGEDHIVVPVPMRAALHDASVVIADLQPDA